MRLQKYMGRKCYKNWYVLLLNLSAYFDNLSYG